MIPAQAVEAAAKAMLAAGNHVGGWDALPVFMQDNYLRDARAALEAAAPYMAGEVERELAEAKRVIALLVLEAGGKVALSSRAITEISDETIIETTQDVINGGWVIRAVRPD